MTKKYKKQHKILKIILFSFLGLSLTSIFFCISIASFITKDAVLDLSRLNTTTGSISFLSDNNQPISALSSANNDKLLESTKNAFIAKEDKRFYSHKGVDYIRILGALKSNLLKGGYAEGGSTITQQLIKNTHLSSEKTLTRKLKEIKLATKLEKKLSKDEILNIYLNSIYFGNGTTGISEASHYYFNKQAQELSLAESAILSGIISAPSQYNPVANLETSKEKGKLVLSLMKEQGYITDEEYANANNEIDNIAITKSSKIGSIYKTMAEYEALEILGLEKFNESDKIVIKTYLNSALQEQLENTHKSEYTKAFQAGGIMPSIASIILDNNSGGVIAFDGISNFNLYSLKRQPASTIKPILVYAPAFEYNGLSPASFILDEPINIGGYAPQNATKKHYGLTTIRDNIVHSTNVPAVKILNEIGLEKAKNFASNFGINFHSEDNNLALALGGFTEGVTIKELATSYMVLANGGIFTPSTFIKEIIINGISVYKNNPLKTRACSPDTAYLITDTLKSVAKYGTGRKISSLNLPIASKTGTNYVDGCNLDGFNASYTTNHTFLSWIGEMGKSTTETDDIYNGSTYPTYVVKDVCEWLYKKQPPQDFIKPQSVVEVKLDQTEFSKGNLVLADKFSIGEVCEVFSISNLPPYRSFIPPIEDVNAKNLSEPNSPNFNLVYENLIKRYGRW